MTPSVSRTIVDSWHRLYVDDGKIGDEQAGAGWQS
jgi:hypothetical protein